MRPSSLSAPFTIALALLLTGGTARAKSEFTAEIASHLRLGYEPPCRLCHIQGTTGPGTVQTPFGVAMLARGLTSSQKTVIPALDALNGDFGDSDGDGVPDVSELLDNTDPNSAAAVPLATEGPDYGCALAPGPAPGPAGGIIAALLAVGLMHVRRRAATRRRRRPPPA